MLPGPVFGFELVATSRRSRFYLVRAFYAAILFLIFWGIHAAWTSGTGGELPSGMVKWFAVSTFCGVTVGQEVLVLLLTPALVAAVIADERQRKTLHYLMASRLSSSEIVLGKLLVRMLYMIVLLGVSLPVLSLLVLMGGIDPKLVLVTCGATFSTAWFLASLSIWVSTLARRVRDAFFITYGLECLWFFSPLLLQLIANRNWPAVSNAAHWCAEWAGASSPLQVGEDLLFGFVGTGGGQRISEMEVIAWMTGLQLIFGLFLAVLAAVQLRPVFRRMDGGSEARAGRGLRSILMSQGRWRLHRRPTLGDRPVLWKEFHTGGAGASPDWLPFCSR